MRRFLQGGMAIQACPCFRCRAPTGNQPYAGAGLAERGHQVLGSSKASQHMDEVLQGRTAV